ncbi:hypothetical protein J9303_17810, partial [Bacillaceae bacterium Marseille-Q3522]|nr:hypothetical protein [Bacillaceae bacterium Marseille-Q3522]
GICLFVYILLVVMFLLSGLPLSLFYVKSFYYILLYWGLTFFISMLMGILFAMVFKGKLVYPLAFLTWPFIGPINNMIFMQITAHTKLFNPYIFSNIFNLGEYNPYASYNDMYGYSLESFHWVKRWIWISLISAAIFIVITMKNKEYRKLSLIGMIFFILSVIPAVFFITTPQFVLKNNGTLMDQPIYDPLYYRNYDLTVGDSPNVQLKNFDIQLGIDEFLEATVKVEMVNQEKKSINKANFTLYHQFKVTKIKMNGKDVGFEQKRDLVTIFFPENIKPAEQNELTFNYRGISSPLFFANNQAVYLPYYFPWIPSTNPNPSIYMERMGMHRVNHQNEITTNYKLSYDGSNHIFTNLEKTSGSIWEKETNGVTVVAGDIRTKKVANTNVIYPYNWEKGIKNFPEYKKLLMETATNIQHDLGLNAIEFPSTIMYLPVLSTGDMYDSEYFWMTKDHFILGEVPYLTPEEDMLYNLRSYFVTKLVSALKMLICI